MDVRERAIRAAQWAEAGTRPGGSDRLPQWEAQVQELPPHTHSAALTQREEEMHTPPFALDAADRQALQLLDWLSLAGAGLSVLREVLR